MAQPARNIDNGETFEPPEPRRFHRQRLHVQGTVARDVAEALRAEAERDGGPFAHTMERVLRKGLGLEEPPRAA